jgi:PAS domain S-box-containing protein
VSQPLTTDAQLALLDAATDQGPPEEVARRFLGELATRLDLAMAVVWFDREGNGRLWPLARWPGDDRSRLPVDPSRLPRRAVARPVLLPGGNNDLAYPLQSSGVLWLRAARPESTRPFVEDDRIARLLARFALQLDASTTLRRTLRRLDDVSAAERQLRELSGHLEVLLESLEGGILATSEAGSITLANRAFCQLFGVPARPQNLIGAQATVATRGSGALFRDPEAFVAGVEKAMTRREPLAGEALEMVDGRILERDYVPIRIDGAPSGHLWHYRDVSERRRAQLEIARLKQFYEDILASMPIQLAVLDPQGRHLHVTPSVVPDAAARTAVVGQTDAESARQLGLPAHVAEERMVRLRDVVRSGQPAVWEESFRDEQGVRVQYLRFVHPVRNAAGRVVQVLRYGVDLTELRRAEAALAASEARKAGVLAASPDAVITFDQQGLVIEVNPAAERIFGYAPGTMLARAMDELLLGDEELTGQEGGLSLHLATSRPDLLGRRVVLTGRRADLATFPAELQIQPIALDDGTLLFTAYIRDITAELAAAENLRAARRAAEVSAQAKESFLANMSHEIRTPLNAVIGMSHLLAGTHLDGEQARYLEGIRFSADTLLALLNSILDLSKIDSGRISFEAIAFDLDELLRGLAEAQRIEASRKGVVLAVSRDPRLAPRLVGDPLRLRQVLLNLVTNALKFTERGQVRVEARLATSEEIPADLPPAEGRLHVLLTVSDTGIGIAPEKLATIFEPFTQERADTTRRFGGTGLGLTIVKELVERQGGRVEVASEVGRGSTFSVLLPFALAGAEAAASGTFAPRLTGPAGGAAPSEPITGVHILLAEDNELNQVVARQLLRRAGADVTVVADGAEAIAALRRGRFDVVLMDIQMPNLDGYAATRIIREELGLSGEILPVIALTASALIEDRHKALEAGMDDFVMKPFHPEQLAEVIARHWQRTQGARASAAAAQDAATAAAAAPPATPAASSGVIDFEVFDGQTMHQADLALEILDLFLVQAPEMSQQIVGAFLGGRMTEVATTAHKLKASAGVLGARELRELVLAIEHGARANVEREELAPLVGRLDAALEVVAEAARAARTRYGG